ncbi:helix-turn-helix domain-containing protein [Microbacterium gilvum]|uniref:Helix-turn-helix domain-containing protein n=1 Tax=Microbacterium gilvum TaxID=1336204 RepID=A0ABP8ZPD6_9MICO
MSRAEGFAAIPNWMVRDKRVPRNAVLVYASLASRSGLGGIHPSQATIATESGLSERTVRSMLAELETLGVVQRVRRTTGKRGRGNRLPDGYTLHPNGSPELAADFAGSSELPEDDAMQPATEGHATGNEQHDVLLYKAEPVEVEPGEVAPRKRGSRIPEPFMLTAEMKAWAAEEVPGLDVVVHTREFVDHWRAATGASATKLDWVATWRNWMRKSHRWQGERSAQRPMPIERAQAVLDMGARLQQQADAQQARRAVEA